MIPGPEEETKEQVWDRPGPDPEAMGFEELLDFVKPYLIEIKEFQHLIKQYQEQIDDRDNSIAPYIDRLEYFLEVKQVKGKRKDRGILMERSMRRIFDNELHAIPEEWKGILTRVIPAQVKLITVKEMDDLLKSREDLDPARVKEILGLREVWTVKVILDE